MARFMETQGAGKRAESEVITQLKHLTKFVYANVRVETLLTKQGNTEIDIVAALGDAILVIEVKHIKEISGSVFDDFWTLTGLSSGEEYKALSPLTQNRIHVRSLKDAWHAARGEWPKVLSYVVVPDGCRMLEEHKDAGVVTMSEFQAILYSISKTSTKCDYGYKLQFHFKEDGGYMSRSDFRGGV